MGFSFMVWNVENFTADDPVRTGKIADAIHENSPDVFSLLEFRARNSARSLVLDNFPDYNFAFTYSSRGMEILTGWKRGKFQQTIYTQRRDFAATKDLRPGGLLSIRQQGQSQFYNLLFLHLDSGTKYKDHYNRRKMYKKIWNLNDKLKELPVQQKKSRLIVLGDLNTMGKKEITGQEEIRLLANAAKRNCMRLLKKSYNYTWKGNAKYPDADLDHVIASSDVDFMTVENCSIQVNGWNQMNSEKEQKEYAKNISDHSYLAGTVID